MQTHIHPLFLLNTLQNVTKIVEPISTVLARSSDEAAASYILFVEGKCCAWPLQPFRPEQK
jgi:hypothetical protein